MNWQYKFCFLSDREIAEQSGIEGILNRLEKERNSILGIGISHTEDSVSPGDSEDKGESHRINSVSNLTLLGCLL